MDQEKKIYTIPDVEIIDSGVDLAGIPLDVVVTSFLASIVLIIISNGFPLLRILAIPFGLLSGFLYYQFITKRDKSFYRQIGYYITVKKVKGLPRPTDKEFME